MGIKPYLIFSLHETRYAIAAEEVREVFLLPELTTVPEAPPDVVGLLDLHSQFIPVMHLDLRFGHKFEGCRLTDSVIVVESHQLQVGVIVHQIETVVEIDDRYVRADLTYGRDRNINRAFIKSVVNLDDEVIILLDVNNLIRHPVALETLTDSEATLVEAAENNFWQRYFDNASSNTQKILHQRAIDLKGAIEEPAATELIPTAVVSIDGSYFGLDLGIVREFIKIGRVTTIPCCPDFVIGNMNLRGEILSLFDIRQPLDLAATNRDRVTKAVVIEIDDITAGIAVEEVYDVIDFHPDELKPVPVATNSNTATYLKAIADYHNKTINLLDLSKLLVLGSMTVELTA